MEGVSVAKNLADLYDDYFPDDPFEVRKNELAASDSVDAIAKLCGPSLSATVDVGAGDGVVTAELAKRSMCSSITALDISYSGLRKIDARNLPGVTAVKFDGYKIPFPDHEFETAVCSHVVEHVEHERIFIREVARVAKSCVFIVPLEGGMRGRVNRQYGHINFFTPLTFANLIETAGLKIDGSTIYASSLSYEQHLGGRLKGAIKNWLRRTLLAFAGTNAPHGMTYVMAIKCSKAA